jgi:hypothetical protein
MGYPRVFRLETGLVALFINSKGCEDTHQPVRGD